MDADQHTEVEGPEVGEGFVDPGPPKYVHGATKEHGRVVIALGRRVRLGKHIMWSISRFSLLGLLLQAWQVYGAVCQRVFVRPH
jgi:hypothetical protein